MTGPIDAVPLQEAIVGDVPPDSVRAAWSGRVPAADCDANVRTSCFARAAAREREIRRAAARSAPGRRRIVAQLGHGERRRSRSCRGLPAAARVVGHAGAAGDGAEGIPRLDEVRHERAGLSLRARRGVVVRDAVRPGAGAARARARRSSRP
jgi:hypothetical protein